MTPLGRCCRKSPRHPADTQQSNHRTQLFESNLRFRSENPRKSEPPKIFFRPHRPTSRHFLSCECTAPPRARSRGCGRCGPAIGVHDRAAAEVVTRLARAARKMLRSKYDVDIVLGV